MPDDKTTLAEPVIATAADPGITINPPADHVDVPATEVMIGEQAHPEPDAIDAKATGDNAGYPAQPGVPADGQVAATADEPKRRRKT